jgi:hypothetical protein
MLLKLHFFLKITTPISGVSHNWTEENRKLGFSRARARRNFEGIFCA